ncbi:MAG TPA: carboxypeptidase regulatory-like domain-containing protein [Pyrinomonadaceae bacterium]
MNSRLKHPGRKRISCFSLFAACLLFAVGPINAQEFRGSITGRVMDAAGAVVPGAQVSATNPATNTSTWATTDDSGDYTILFLNPGKYNLTVEARGFKKLLRQDVEVRVGDKLTLDLTLEVGEIVETVNITTETPLLEAATASSGQVIDRRRISELPLSDGNPFVLSRLAPGITYTGDLKFSRPFDNLGTSSVVSQGAPGGNEFTLDGSPNTHGREPRVSFVPPADAVQEFKVVTNSFDAQQGHTAGANIDVTLRNGTNDFHGSLYEFVRNDILSANDFFLNRAGQERDALRYNRYGGTFGGPVTWPRFGEGGRAFVSGRNRYFFFFAYEGLKDAFPEPGLFTVPTLAERRGDFSALLPLGIQIYDPLTAVMVGNRVQRTPFANNIIPAERISAVARAFLQFYPLPNQPGDAQGRNNFISPNPRTDTFNSESLRLDFSFNDRHTAFFRYTRNNRLENRGNWTGVVNGIRPTGTLLFRNNNGATYDHIYTASPTLVFNFRAGYTRFDSPTVRESEGAFDPASLGFSSRTAALFSGLSYFPRFETGAFSPLGDPLGSGFTDSIYSFQPTATKITGGHTLRIGYDFRAYREDAYGLGHAAGRYDFGTDFTRGPLDTSAPGAIGQELASFLLGQPTGGILERNTARSNQTLYHGIFLQDDWKATKNLTLNLGVRYEYEGATTERFNRNVRGFDETTPNPVEAAARAAYAVNPIPEIPAQNFRVRGGLLFADDNNRGFWEPDRNNIQPRLGFAYRINDRTVVRGGWAIYTIPFIIDGVGQFGFSQSTTLVPTLDNGLTFRASLFDPFPEGLAAAPGSTPGLATFIGRDIEFVPVNRSNGQAQRWQLNMEREIPGQWLFEIAYIGNYGYDLTTETDALNAVPRRFLSTSASRDQAVIDFLTATVANPFQGLAPGTTLNSATVQRQQLLRPFPQFGNIRTRGDDGSSIYHAGQVRVEKRFTDGYTLLASYTFSKLLERVSLLNPTDAEYEKRISANDAPHRLALSGIWELPFGKNRRWGAGWNPLAEAVFGGWQLQAIWQAQSGRPLELGNLYFNGDPSELRVRIDGSTVDAVFDTSGFYFTDAAVQTNGVVDPAKQRNDPRIRLAFNVRRFPSRLANFRGQPLNLWDISLIKNFLFTDRTRLQLRGEFLNAFNHPQFNNPILDPTSTNFGRVTGQANLPRNIQLGIKLIF